MWCRSPFAGVSVRIFTSVFIRVMSQCSLERPFFLVVVLVLVLGQLDLMKWVWGGSLLIFGKVWMHLVLIPLQIFDIFLYAKPFCLQFFSCWGFMTASTCLKLLGSRMLGLLHPTSFFGKFWILVSVSTPAIGLFRFSVSSWLTYVCWLCFWDLSISSSNSFCPVCICSSHLHPSVCVCTCVSLSNHLSKVVSFHAITKEVKF